MSFGAFLFVGAACLLICTVVGRMLRCFQRDKQEPQECNEQPEQPVQPGLASNSPYPRVSVAQQFLQHAVTQMSHLKLFGGSTAIFRIPVG